eukprot:gene7506-8933_t
MRDAGIAQDTLEWQNNGENSYASSKREDAIEEHTFTREETIADTSEEASMEALEADVSESVTIPSEDESEERQIEDNQRAENAFEDESEDRQIEDNQRAENAFEEESKDRQSEELGGAATALEEQEVVLSEILANASMDVSEKRTLEPVGYVTALEEASEGPEIDERRSVVSAFEEHAERRQVGEVDGVTLAVEEAREEPEVEESQSMTNASEESSEEPYFQESGDATTESEKATTERTITTGPPVATASNEESEEKQADEAGDVINMAGEGAELGEMELEETDEDLVVTRLEGAVALSEASGDAAGSENGRPHHVAHTHWMQLGGSATPAAKPELPLPSTAPMRTSTTPMHSATKFSWPHVPGPERVWAVQERAEPNSVQVAVGMADPPTRPEKPQLNGTGSGGCSSQNGCICEEANSNCRKAYCKRHHHGKGHLPLKALGFPLTMPGFQPHQLVVQKGAGTLRL